MYKRKYLKYWLNVTISFKYWRKFDGIRGAWVYTDKVVSEENENYYELDFGLTLVGEDLFQLPDGTEFEQSEDKAIYLKEDKNLIPCKIVKGLLVKI